MLDDLYPPETIKLPARVSAPQKQKDGSECNTLVILFIGGVLGLALIDSLQP